MKLSWLTVLSRSYTSLRRWLRHAWFDRLPLASWYEGMRERWAKAGRTPGTPYYARLELFACEERTLPGNTLNVLTSQLLGAAGNLMGATSTAAATPSPSQAISVLAAETGSVPAAATSVPPASTASVSVADNGTAYSDPAADLNTPVAAHANNDATEEAPPESLTSSADNADGDPFADPLAAVFGSTPAAGPSGGGGGGSAGGGGSGGGVSGASPAAEPANGPTPLLASTTSPGDDLWRSANRLAGSAATPVGAQIVPTAALADLTTRVPVSTTSLDIPTTTPPLPAPSTPPVSSGSLPTRTLQSPLVFEPNRGQVADSNVLYFARGHGFTLFLTDTGPIFNFAPTGAAKTSDILSFHLDGANAQPTIVATDQTAAHVNYFLGNDPSKWLRDVPQFSTITYQNVYSGIDLVFHSAGTSPQDVEYDFQVHAQADLSSVHLTWNGAQSLTVGADGNLHLQTAGGDIVQKAPVLYQLDGATKVAVAGQGVLLGNYQVGFTAGAYDHTKTLIVDPVVSQFSTLDGSTGDDYAYAIAVGSDGNITITGGTSSTDLPGTTSPPPPSPPPPPPAGGLLGSFNGGATDVFVSRFDSSGTLLYSDYIGGTGDEEGYGVAVDNAGNTYVVGDTTSGDFPLAGGTSYGSETTGSVFVFELSSAGTALTYSGLDSSASTGNAIAVDGSSGTAYYTGAQGHNLYVTQLNPAGVHSDGTLYQENPYFLGGSDVTVGNGIAVDGSGNAYVTGATTDGAVSEANTTVYGSLSGSSDAFVLTLNDDASSNNFVYVGGSGSDSAQAIALAGNGDVYIAGETDTYDLSATTMGFQTLLGPGGGEDTFIAKIDPSTEALSNGTYMLYSTYLGGSSTDVANGIAVDAHGYVTVTGTTSSSSDFPMVNALEGTYGGGSSDAFAARLSASGNALSYSMYWGGSDTDAGMAVALDSSGNGYFAGYTNSPDYPDGSGGTSGGTGYVSTAEGFDGGEDADLEEIDAPDITVTPAPNNINASQMQGSQAESTIAVDPTHPDNQFVASMIADGTTYGPGYFAAYSTDGGGTWNQRTIATGTDSLPKWALRQVRHPIDIRPIRKLVCFLHDKSWLRSSDRDRVRGFDYKHELHRHHSNTGLLTSGLRTT